MVMFQLLVLSLFALAQTSKLKDGKREWELFKITYAKEYPTLSEENRRMEIFLKNVQLVREHNAKHNNGEVSFTTSINAHSDLSNEEISTHRKGVGSITKGERIKGKRVMPKFKRGTTVPSSIDWRTKGAVTPVKDQRYCLSCWAFSAVASLEGQYFIKNKNLVSFSEQNLIDCAPPPQCNGCHGGHISYAFSYINTSGGIDTEASYPYEGQDDECHFKSSFVRVTVKDVGYTSPGDETALQASVATIGPMSVHIDASDPKFAHYEQGVYDNPNCASSLENLDHAVLVVGYGTTQDGKDYWLVKNSWGTNWGMAGYFMMARNKNNMCGIATKPLYPII